MTAMEPLSRLSSQLVLRRRLQAANSRNYTGCPASYARLLAERPPGWSHCGTNGVRGLDLSLQISSGHDVDLGAQSHSTFSIVR